MKYLSAKDEPAKKKPLAGESNVLPKLKPQRQSMEKHKSIKISNTTSLKGEPDQYTMILLCTYFVIPINQKKYRKNEVITKACSVVTVIAGDKGIILFILLP
jgi:hypothetical protein